MEKKIIHTTSAPAPIGPYSQAVMAGSLLFISGQIAINPTTQELIKSDIIAEAHQVMQNLKHILAEAGLDFGDVIKSTIFVTDLNHFSAVNEVYGKYFHDYFPARETVQVAALPRGVNVEISMIACK
ncbi:MAG: RidA family protein [Chitinophagaceae bacterium]